MGRLISEKLFVRLDSQLQEPLLIPEVKSFEGDLRGYLSGLDESKIHSLADLIEFNKAHPDLELPIGTQYHPQARQQADEWHSRKQPGWTGKNAQL